MAKVNANKGANNAANVKNNAKANNANKNNAAKKAENLFDNNKKADNKKATAAPKAPAATKGATKAEKQAAKAKESGSKAKVNGNTVTITKANGNKVQKTYNDDGTIATKTVKTKDKNGNTTKKTTDYTYRDNGKLKNTVTKKGDKTVTTRYDKSGNVRSKYVEQGDNKTTYNYQDGKKVSRYSEKPGESSMVYYDKNGKKTSKTVNVGEGENATVINVSYKNGVRSGKTITGKVNGQDTTVESKFDKNGKISERKTTSKDDEGNDVVKTESWSRNEDGTVKSKKTVNGDKTTTREYTYDKNDPTKRTVTIDSINSTTGNHRIYTETQVLNDKGKVVSTERKDEEGNVVRKTQNTYDENGNKTGAVIDKYNIIGNHTTITRTNMKKDTSGNVSYDETTTKVDKDGNKLAEDTQGSKIRHFNGVVVDAQTGAKEANEAGVPWQANGAEEANQAEAAPQAAEAEADPAANNDVPAGAEGIKEGSTAKNALNQLMTNLFGSKTAEFIKQTWNTICEWLGFSEQERFAGETMIDTQFAQQGDITDDGVRA